MLPCHGCGYVRPIPGDAHRRCVFDWIKYDLTEMAGLIARARLTPQTVRWFRFPFNYDPVWGPNTCPQRTDRADPTKIAPQNPWADLLSLLQ